MRIEYNEYPIETIFAYFTKDFPPQVKRSECFFDQAKGKVIVKLFVEDKK